MVRNWVAGLLAAGGVAAGALVGPHVPGLAASGVGQTAESALADRIAIEDLLTHYYEHFGSAGASEEFAGYYTDDAVFDVNGIVATGREEIAALYAGMGEDGEAPATQGTFRMIISNPVIEVNGDEATAKVVWTGVMNADVGARPTLWEQGREYDRLVRRDGKWLIQKRVVIADSGLPDSMKATYTPRLDYRIDADE